jgi:hypothetical protein
MISAPTPPPTDPDAVEIENTLRTLFRPDDVIEIRVFEAGNSGTISGFFDDFHKAAVAAASIDRQAVAPGVYVTLNEVDPAYLALSANRLTTRAKKTTPDKGILRRRYIPVDLDPKRGLTDVKGISATDEEMWAAIERAHLIQTTLHARGMVEPFTGWSGNGGHLLYPIDLPNNDESTAFVENFLKRLATEFDDDRVKVDCSMFNAGRIISLYGTVKRKGDQTHNRLHRRTRMGAFV